jgi:arylsulfatase A-like enzyme
MRNIVRISLLCSLMAFLVPCAEAKTASRPNVLLIYTDDHRYSGVHALGGEAILTPSIDALAADGIAFTQAFLMGSFHPATCVPSRAMLMSLGAYLTDHYRMPMWGGVGNHGLLGKQNVYDEDGLHVPFILSGGVVQNKMRRENALCYIHDIYPTVCDFVGIPIPESVTGKSLMPVINHETENVRAYTYHAFLQYQRTYRKGDYKLIEYVKAPTKRNSDIKSGSRVTQLFNIKEDKWAGNC